MGKVLGSVHLSRPNANLMSEARDEMTSFAASRRWLCPEAQERRVCWLSLELDGVRGCVDILDLAWSGGVRPFFLAGKGMRHGVSIWRWTDLAWIGDHLLCAN
jgi:hypothetical protein